MYHKSSRPGIGFVPHTLILAAILLSGCASVSDSTAMGDAGVQALVGQAFADRLAPGTIVARVGEGQIVQVWRIEHEGRLGQVSDDDRQAILAQAQAYLRPHRDCFTQAAYRKVVMLDIQSPAQATAMLCEGGGDLHAGLCDEMQLAKESSQWVVLASVQAVRRGPCQCRALWPAPTPARPRTNEP